MQAYAERKYASAVKEFETALASGLVDDLYRLYITKAQCHSVLECWADGLNAARQAIGVDSGRPEAYLCMVSICSCQHSTWMGPAVVEFAFAELQNCQYLCVMLCMLTILPTFLLNRSYAHLGAAAAKFPAIVCSSGRVLHGKKCLPDGCGHV